MPGQSRRDFGFPRAPRRRVVAGVADKEALPETEPHMFRKFGQTVGREEPNVTRGVEVLRADCECAEMLTGAVGHLDVAKAARFREIKCILERLRCIAAVLKSVSAKD